MGIISTPPYPPFFAWYFIITYTEHDVSLPSGIQINTEEYPRDAEYTQYTYIPGQPYTLIYINIQGESKKSVISGVWCKNVPFFVQLFCVVFFQYFSEPRNSLEVCIISGLGWVKPISWSLVQMNMKIIQLFHIWTIFWLIWTILVFKCNGIWPKKNILNIL